MANHPLENVRLRADQKLRLIRKIINDSDFYGDFTCVHACVQAVIDDDHELLDRYYPPWIEAFVT